MSTTRVISNTRTVVEYTEAEFAAVLGLKDVLAVYSIANHDSGEPETKVEVVTTSK
jgi:hypothetical protein